MEKSLQISGNMVKFCKQCQYLLQIPLPRKVSLNPDHLQYELKCVHHETSTSFLMAIRMGCSICALVFNECKIKHPSIAEALEPWIKKGNMDLVSHNDVMSFKNALKTTWHRDVLADISRDSLKIEIFKGTETQNDPKAAPLISITWEIIPFEVGSSLQSPHSALNLTSTASIDVNPWLQDCLSNHTCWRDSERDYLPPRFIDCTGETLRLILCEEVESSHMYAALSHCWGTRPTNMVLTTENLDEFRKGLNYDLLPPTFRDAVQITRKLGIPYLWIDSVCIIQKGSLHKADWNRHVREMASIYSNCVINIAASHAADSNGGCFSNPSELANPIVIPSPNIDHSLVPQAISRGPGSLWMLDCTEVLLYPKPGLSVLNGRAWVYQERLLSPRIVHYERNDVYWECYESYKSALFPEGPKHFPFRKPMFLQDVPLFDWRLSENGPSGPLSGMGHYSPFFFWGGSSSLFHNWGAIVHFFSSCRLTRQSDKFPAIAAIAQRLSVQTGEKYVAGFFKSLLPRALLWRDHSDGIYSEEYVAPTWSWASVTGTITWAFQAAADLRCQPRKHSINLVDKLNEFGQISWGSLELEGTMLPIRRYHTEKSIETSLYVENIEAPDSQKLNSLDIRSVEAQGIITVISQWDNKNIPAELNLAFFAIAESKDSDNMVYGLVLNRQGSCYVRLGTVQVRTEKGWNMVPNRQSVIITMV